MQRDTHNPFFAMRKKVLGRDGKTMTAKLPILEKINYLYGLFIGHFVLVFMLDYFLDDIKGVLLFVAPLVDAIDEHIPSVPASLQDLSPDRALYFRSMVALNIVLFGVVVLFVLYRFMPILRRSLFFEAASHVPTALVTDGVAPNGTPMKQTYGKRQSDLRWAGVLGLLMAFAVLWLPATPHPTGRSGIMMDNHLDFYFVYQFFGLNVALGFLLMSLTAILAPIMRFWHRITRQSRIR